jgi:hypothetical protein
MGRQLELNDTVQGLVLEAIKAAVPFETAAGYAGIDRATFWRWMDLGKPDHACVLPDDKQKPRGPCVEAAAGRPHPAGTCPDLARYRDFRDAVEREEHRLHMKLAGALVLQAPKDARAALAVLKAKWPEHWNVPERREISGPDGGAIEIAPARERLAGKITELAQRALTGGAPKRRPAHDDGLDHDEEDTA